jgi:hypothetical protein
MPAIDRDPFLPLERSYAREASRARIHQIKHLLHVAAVVRVYPQ